MNCEIIFKTVFVLYLHLIILTKNKEFIWFF